MLASSSRRFLSSSARFTLPPFQGEVMKNYAPGSHERHALSEALAAAKSEVVDIPCVVNGKEYFTDIVQEQVLILPLLLLLLLLLLPLLLLLQPLLLPRLLLQSSE
jgi:hypothetical protein